MAVKENKKTLNAVTLATTDVIDNCIYFAFLDLELMSGTLEKDYVWLTFTHSRMTYMLQRRFHRKDGERELAVSESWFNRKIFWMWNAVKTNQQADCLMKKGLAHGTTRRCLVGQKSIAVNNIQGNMYIVYLYIASCVLELYHYIRQTCFFLLKKRRVCYLWTFES